MSEKGTDQLSGEAPGQEGIGSRGDWKFWAPLLIGVLVAIYILFWHGMLLFNWIAAYLPLLLPLAVTFLSIFTRAADIRNYESVLKIANDVAIGIISFDIWAISASRSNPSGRILVNPEKMINGDFVLPFLLAGLLVAVGCVVLTQYKFQNARNKQRWLLAGLIASAIIYVVPFGLVEPVKQLQAKPTVASHRYTVVIPYQDPVITRVAPMVLRERFFARFEKDVEATSEVDARAIALKRFLSSEESVQFKNKSGAKVHVHEPGILLVAQ